MARAATASPAVSASIVAEPPPAAPRVAPPIAPSIAPAVPQRDFEGLARQVAEAEHVAEQATAAMRDGKARLDQIGSRIAILEAEKASIIDRRAGGVHEPDDGPRLSLLDADVLGLARLRSDAAAALALKQTEVTTAERALGFARERLAVVEAEKQYDTLAAHASALCGLLHATVVKLAALELRTHRSVAGTWSAAPELIAALRKQAFSARVGW